MVLSVLGIAASLVVAKVSDKFGWRKYMVTSGLFAGGLGCISLTIIGAEIRLISVATVFLLSLSYSSTAQVFAIAKEYSLAEIGENGVGLFNAIVRVQIAISWIIGPPAGFWLIDHWGPVYAYELIGVVFILTGLQALFFLPKARVTETPLLNANSGEVEARGNANNISIYLSVFAFTVLNAANYAYLISLPLYLKSHFMLDVGFAGYLMGVAAAIEIPIMLAAGYFCSKYSIYRLIRLAIFSGLLFFMALGWVFDLPGLFFIQILNAFFMGIVSALGITWFQSLLPRSVGYSSTLYTSCITAGNILGAVVVTVVSHFVGVESLFVAMFLLVAAGYFTFVKSEFARSSRKALLAPKGLSVERLD